MKANSRREEILKSASEDNIATDITKDPNLESLSPEAWLGLSEDDLFICKKETTLASLLSAKYTFRKLDIRNNLGQIRYLATSKEGLAALETVLSEYRKDGMANHVMDVSVCGAVAPYGAILTGKLFTMLLLSKEVDEQYRERYGSKPRIIASQMAGRPIVKPTSVRILTTTSLFGVGTSHYNRSVLRAADHQGISNDLRWEKLGEQSAGYGTIHLSEFTQQLLRAVAIQTHGSRRINSRFGEGTSARMKQAREGLDSLRLDSDRVLKHDMTRIILGSEAELDVEKL